MAKIALSENEQEKLKKSAKNELNRLETILKNEETVATFVKPFISLYSKNTIKNQIKIYEKMT